MLRNEFSNKHLKKCSWSKDPKKRYNQLKHFSDNHSKYDISIVDLIKISNLKKETYKLINSNYKGRC